MVTKESLSPGNDTNGFLSKSVGTEIDKKALEKDGLLDKYSKEKIGYRFTQSAIEGVRNE